MHARTIVGFSAAVLLVMVAALAALQWQTRQDPYAERLVLYCAAAIQGPVQDTIEEYQRYYRQRHGRAIRIVVEYGGSGTLLSRLQVERAADLYLAGDESFIDIARQQGLVDESVPLATMTPVLALAEGKAGAVRSVQEVLDGDYRVGIGVPDGTAIGAATRSALKATGQWEQLEREVEVTKPTVNDLAGDVQIGAIDAAIIWNVTARQFGLDYVTDDALSRVTGRVEIGVLASTRQPTAALHFARFLAAPEKGLRHFQAHPFDVVEGDRWADVPEVTFFSGGVNRRAMEPILEAFERREGVRINTVYQDCGALNAQMAAVRAQDADHGFPDAYLAYYSDTLPERDRLHVVELNHDYARAVQPFGIASTSKHKHLMLRLYRFIGRSQAIYEELGFGWELGRSPDDFQLVAPAGARPLRIDGGDAR